MRRLHRRRRRRLRACGLRGRRRRADLLDLDGRRRVTRAARREGTSGRGSDPVLIAGNWKMYKGPREAGLFCRALREADLGGVEIAVCPPFVPLACTVQVLAGAGLGVFSPSWHW